MLEQGLGRDFAFTATGIKKYPCCLCSHAALDAAFGLMREENIAAADVSAAHVTISPYASRIVGAPFEPGNDPQVAAQFSVQYVVACAIFLGRFTLAEIEPETVRAPASIGRTSQVTVGVDESWPGHLVPSAVTVRTKSGREFTRRIDEVPGSPANPLSASDLSAKFADCVGRGSRPLTKSEAAAFEKRMSNVAALTEIDALWASAASRSAA
jgi:2-methylcitrate dehydratase PrpD